MIRAYRITRQYGVSFAGLVILDILAKEGESFESALARRMKISDPAVYGAIHDLIDRGYAEVRRARADRRRRLLSITPEGKELLTKGGEDD